MQNTKTMNTDVKANEGQSMNDWVENMPTLADMDVVLGTPIRVLEHKVPSGFPVRNNTCLTVRPWGDEHETHCMIVDEKGTSIPCRMDALVIDLDHPLGFAAATHWVYNIVDGGEGPLFGFVERIARGLATNEDKVRLSQLMNELTDSPTTVMVEE